MIEDLKERLLVTHIQWMLIIPQYNVNTNFGDNIDSNNTYSTSVISGTIKDEVSEIVEFNIDWGGISRTPFLNFLKEIMEKLAYCFFLAILHIGRKVVTNSTESGYLY